MSEEKIEEKNEEVKKEPVIRQIIIETNGNMIRVAKAEVAGKIEMVAILENLATFYKQNN